VAPTAAGCGRTPARTRGRPRHPCRVGLRDGAVTSMQVARGPVVRSQHPAAPLSRWESYWRNLCTLPLLAGENIGSRFVVPTVAGYRHRRASRDRTERVPNRPRDRRCARPASTRRCRAGADLRLARRPAGVHRWIQVEIGCGAANRVPRCAQLSTQFRAQVGHQVGDVRAVQDAGRWTHQPMPRTRTAPASLSLDNRPTPGPVAIAVTVF
jgi:hypothetical protein